MGEVTSKSNWVNLNMTTKKNILPLAVLAGGVWLAAAMATSAAHMVHEFYLPLPEDQAHKSFKSVAGRSSIGTVLESVTSIVVTGPDTVIHYDHWEDGYEVDISQPTQSTTEIWGDGNDANGIAPGYSSDPMGLPIGAVIPLRNQVALPRNPGMIRFDGRDRVAASKAIVVTRALWPVNPGPVLAEAVEVTATIDHGLHYISPVGQDVNANQMFEYVGLAVMADENNTQVSIKRSPSDPNPIQVTLNRGESYYVDGGILKGAEVVATKPVQTHILTGDIDANYETRWFTLTPVEDWYNAYITPVGTANNGHEAYLFVYNPHASAITIEYEDRNGDGTFEVGPGESVQWLIPRSSGARLVSAGGETFFAVTAVGAKPSANNAHDWGFALIPEDGLTTIAVVGWGPGSSDGKQNGSPVWVSPMKATRIYVDFKGDGQGPLTDPNGNKYDVAYDVAALESKTIYDPSKDLTAMRIYTLDGTVFATAWGQDPAVAAAGNPYLDLGTTVLPLPEPIIRKRHALAVDVNGDGKISFGDTLTYTVEVDNRGLLPLGNVVVLDELPEQIAYIADSTTWDGVPIPDDTEGATRFPLDEDGFIIPIILRGGSSVFTYDVQIVGYGMIKNVAGNVQYGIEDDNEVAVEVPEGCDGELYFADAQGDPQTTYPEGADIYLWLDSLGSNADPHEVDTVRVLVRNSKTGDLEYLRLTETGPNTGEFFSEVPLPSSASSGLVPEDGTLYARPGDTLSVRYTDPVCPATWTHQATILTPSEHKPLYLQSDGADNDLSGAMNRLDPVEYEYRTLHQTTFNDRATLATIEVVGPAVASNSAQTANSYMFDYYSGSFGTNRVLMVGISYNATIMANRTVSSVTYGGVALTQVATAGSTTQGRIYMYRLLDPPRGVHSLAVSWNGNLANGAVVGAVTYGNVDQSVPLGVAATATGNNGVPTVSVASSAKDVVFGVVQGRSTSAFVGGAGGEERWSERPFANTSGSAQDKPGNSAGTTDLIWTGSSAAWAVGGVALKPAPSRELVRPAVSTVSVAGAAASWTPAINANYSTTYHSGSTGDNRLLVVAISASDQNATGITLNRVTYGNQEMSFVGSVAREDASRMSLYTLQDPPTGNNTLALTWSSTQGWAYAVGAITFAGVDPHEPFGDFYGSSGSSAAASLTLPSAAGELVFAAVANGGSGNISISGTGGTSLWTNRPSSGIAGGGQTKPGAASVSMSWTVADASWAVGAISLKAVRGNPEPFVFTQTPSFCSDFILPAGGEVSASFYIKTAGNDLPAQPEFTLRLSERNNVFATLSHATATHVGNAMYRVDWTGAIPEKATIPPGAAVTASLENETLAPISVVYGHQDYPSQISLPTTTVIAMENFGMYDAPYPDGQLINGVLAGDKAYIRATVMDPFGSDDITGLDLAVDHVALVSFGPDDAVASDPCTKTYEYEWTPANEGTYEVTAVAREGTEGITAEAVLPFDVIFRDLGSPCLIEFTDGLDGEPTHTFAPGAEVCIRVTDFDQNHDAFAKETVTVTLLGAANDSETMILTETDFNSGIFAGCIPAGLAHSLFESSDNGILYAPAGTVLEVNYQDVNDPTDICTATARVPLPGDLPGINISKTVVDPTRGWVLVGDTLTYRVRVVNSGARTLNNVTVTDTYPPELQFISATPSDPSSHDVSQRRLTWADIGALAPGDSKVFMLTFGALAPAHSVTNSAQAEDSVENVSDEAEAPIEITLPRHKVTKTLLSPSPAAYGDSVTYRIVVTNTGSTTITSLPLEDKYSPAYLRFVSATTAPEGAGGGVLFWENIAAPSGLGVNQAITIDVTFEVVGAAAPVRNLAAVNYSEDEKGDPVPSDEDEDDVLVTEAGAITGHVWHDENKNATNDVGEAGIAGVSVRLYTDPNGDGDPSDGVLVAVTTTSGADGTYEFPNLPPGNYVVVETDPPGFGSTGDVDGVNDNRVAVEIVGGETVSDRDFYDYKIPPMEYATVSGTVWLDENLNGTNDVGEAGIPGVTVELYLDVNNNGQVDAGEPVVAVVQTDRFGHYSFPGLPPGNYIVREIDPPGHISTGDVDGANDNQVRVTVAGGEHNQGNDFFDAKESARLYGYAFFDEDQSLTRTAGDDALEAVEVRLYKDGQLMGTTFTDENGFYEFDNLPSGYYEVRFYNEEGILIDVPGPGTPAVSDAERNRATNAVDYAVAYYNLYPGHGRGQNTGEPVNAGYGPPAALGDWVWLDLDGNGQQDAGEPGVGGIAVTLYNAESNVVAVTTTAPSGEYLFTNLPPGKYFVAFEQPPAYFFTLYGAGDAARDSDVLPATNRTPFVTLGVSETNRTVDAGYYQPPSSIGDWVWHDANGDGIQNGSETGMPNVVVTLHDAASNVVATTQTDSSGHYRFPDLAPGYYYIHYTLPNGYMFTAPGQGQSDERDSDAGQVCGCTELFFLPPGTDDLSWDAGLVPATYGLQITKTSDASSCLLPGQSLRYTIVVANTGNVAQAGIVVQDVLPAGVSYIPGSVFAFNPTGRIETVTFNANDTFTVPEGITTLTVEAWGGGGGGSSRSSNGAGGGGGGGAYSRGTFAVTPGQTYTVNVGSGGDSNTAGSDSWFRVGTTTNVLARGGTGGSANNTNGVAGGVASTGIGDFRYSGGRGANATGTTAGGGGGSSAGTNAAGNNATTSTGAVAPAGGGNGGNGATSNANGSPGSAPGGGGGGARRTSGTRTGGAGGAGRILVSYDTSQATSGTPGTPPNLWTNGLLGYQESIGFSFDVVVTEGTTVTQFLNTASVYSSAQGARNATVTNCVQYADVGVTKAVSTATPAPGANFTYTLVATNRGPNIATGVQITDLLPAGVTYVSHSGGTYNAGTGVWDVGTLAINRGTSLTITAVAPGNSGGLAITNRATVTGRDLYDPNPSNDTAEVVIQQRPAAIGDFVWEDLDGNGQQDAGEPGLPNVTVRLYNNAAEQIATTRTDATGAYLFTGLAPGDYFVEFIAPNGYVITRQNAASDDVDNDADPQTGRTTTYPLTAGQTNQTVDAGFFRKISLGERVWYDANLNGIQDPEETQGVAQVPVALLDSEGNVIARTITGTDGKYLFTGLLPGTYTVQFDLSAIIAKSWITTPKQGSDDSVDSDGQYISALTGLVTTDPITLISGDNYHDVDLGIRPQKVTRADVADVWGEWRDGRGAIGWRTESEWGTAGFLLARVDEATGAETPLNTVAVPASLSANGAVYSLADPAATRAGRGRYRLSEIEFSGEQRDLGTHDVEFGTPPPQAAAARAALAAGRGLQAATAPPSPAPLALPGASPVLKVQYREPGIYAVALADIAAGMGREPAELAALAAANELTFRQADAPLPTIYDEAHARILFYGTATTNWYARDNAAIISVGRGLAMPRREPAATSGETVLPVQVRWEEDRYPLDQSINWADDLYYWDYVIAGTTPNALRTFPVDLTGCQGDVELTVRLKGWSSSTNIPDHSAEIYWNGALVAAETFDDTETKDVTFTVPPAAVFSGENTLAVKGILLPGRAASFFVVDWLSASFDRAIGPASATAFYNAGAEAISAAAYTAPVALALDTAGTPTWLADAAGALPARAFAAAAADASYALAEAAGIPALAPTAVNAQPWFLAADHRVDYLIITSRHLEEAAQPLADYRASQGLRVGIATFEDLCDWFAAGVRTPEAIPAFLRHAVATWAEAPWLVVFVGNGHYDYLNALALEVNHVPPMMAPSIHGTFASDALLTDLDADGHPDIAAGRLPAQDPNELAAMIAKIQAYEADFDSSWSKQLLLVADASDLAAGDFRAANSNFAAQARTRLAVANIELDEVPLKQATTALTGWFNTGAGIIHYTGHGNINMLGANLFTSTHVGKLSNSRPPVVLALSCLVGCYEIPGMASLGERLLAQSGGGAVAVWSPSGHSLNHQAEELGLAFYDAIIHTGAGTLGQAVLQARRAQPAELLTVDTYGSYNLLGDPALRIIGNRVATPAATSFAQWRWEQFSPADLANDAISGTHPDNFRNYAMGGGYDLTAELPEFGHPFNPATVGTDDELILHWKRRIHRNDLRYRLYISPDLKTWEADPAGTEILDVESDPDGIMETIRTRIHRPDLPAIFIGIKAEPK